MIPRLLFCLICTLPYSAFGQTCGTGHCPQPNDEIARHAISMSDAGLPGRNVTWSLADMRMDNHKTIQTFRLSDDTIPNIVSSERAYIKHLQHSPDGLYERSAEDNLQNTS